MFEELTVFQDVYAAAAVRLAFALLCGFLLGMEREINEKPAGLRTLILITVGATLFMIVSDLIGRVTQDPPNITTVDPSRVASQVVLGIGFIGGGAIIQSRGAIRGLTTAAAIWVAAGVGLLIGAGFPVLGTAVTLLVLVVLVLLDPIRGWFSRRGEINRLELILPNDSLVLKRVNSILLGNDIPADQIRLELAPPNLLRISLTYRARKAGKQHLLDELAAVEGVRGAEVAV